MKYILTENYVLRGYDSGKIKVLVNMDSDDRMSLQDRTMDLLQMCDGETDCSLFESLPGVKKVLDLALQSGWIRTAKEGERIQEFQAYKETSAPLMHKVQWSVTGRCNAACRHCFITEHQHCHKDLSTEEMLQIIQKLADAFIYRVALTGGEPLVRKDLPVLLKAMQEARIKVTRLYTNGFLLDDNMLDLFLQYGMRPEIQISFDGVGHHDWMRGVPGAQNMAAAAMDRCKAKGFPFRLAMSVHKGNQDTFAETVKLAAEKGAEKLSIGAVEPVGDFVQEKGIRTLDSDEMYQLALDYLSILLEEKADIPVELFGFPLVNGSHPESFGALSQHRYCHDDGQGCFCNTVRTSFYIADDGAVLPCILTAGTFLEAEALKISEHTLEECLGSPACRGFVNVLIKDVAQHNPDCLNCEYLSECGCGCRARSATEFGSLYEIEKDTCAFYRDGWSKKLADFYRSSGRADSLQ